MEQGGGHLLQCSLWDFLTVDDTIMEAQWETDLSIRE